MAWVKPRYSKEQINRAGKTLVRSMEFELDNQAVPWEEFEQALAVINNWRSSHGYPLISFRINLTRIAKKFDPKALIAQRVKRLVSIGIKLERFPTMKLSQMQDLGGCRAILSNVAAVRGAVNHYKHSRQMRHSLSTIDDYIIKPKPSGYRGVHLVYRYHSETQHKKIYNGLKIEIQLRSKYQHAWATAVETVGTFSGQALKSSLGSEEWQRFFMLMGSVIAYRERSPLVPDTPVKRSELLEELAHYTDRLKVEERLRGYRDAVSAMSSADSKQNADYFLLELNPAIGRLIITGFLDIDEAAGRYAEAEKAVRESPGTDAVLVSVGSIHALGRAYPNYFADTRAFAQLVNQALSGRARGIEVPPVQIKLV